MTLASGTQCCVDHLSPQTGEAAFFHNVRILEDIDCHLATANLAIAEESWAVLSDATPSLQTFARYGERFGEIEPQFKDYKSAACELIRSHLLRLRSPHPLVDSVPNGTVIGNID